GDSSDDIPGVAGIGPKWAAKLLDQFGNLEMLLANKDKIENPNIRAKIVKNEELARLSKELATVEKNIPIDLNPEDWKLKEANYPKLLQLYEKLDFHSLIKSIPSVGKNIEGDYLLIDTEQLLIDLVQRLATTKTVAINHYFESKEDIIDAKLNGISISTRANEGFYIPLRENRAKILSLLEALLEDEQITKIGANLKELIILLANEGINLKGRLFDIIIVAYLLEPDKNHTVSKLAFSNLSIDMESTVKPDTLIDENSLKSYGADADIILRLYETLKVKLKAESLDQLNKTIEEPLIRVLASMEQSGILVDNGVLNQLSDELKEKLTKLEDEIFAQAGEEFNLNSPKQLAKVLFENLKLPHFKKTKSGYSTDHSVLVHLAKIDPLPKLILEYRRLSKLKNGYSDPLPKLINKRSRRIHTSFNQTVAATGRLSSSDPNLQNIPTREVEGKIIRSAFVADNQFLLISSDYSQIELRLLAHFSDEDTLIDAFIRSADIHLDTACKIYNVTPELITKDMRHAAKTVNYSVIYGKTPFGLAEDLQIPINVAKKFIDDYFAMFPKIQQYIDKTIDEAGETLFVKTLFDRKRFFPDLRSKNRHLLSAARRGAINAIMQGSAADIIKYAMIKISNRLIDESLKSKMLLQVHDELLFEAPLDEVDYLSELVKEEMESHFDLKVPLLVDINSAANWNLAH
ncbi:MAG: DNA polymerase I, partial [Nitrospinota bacterium]